MESAYTGFEYHASELQHRYGDRVHILAEPYLLTTLGRLCSPEVAQPRIHDLIELCYRSLLERIVNQEFPRVLCTSDTRMVASTDRGRYHGDIIDPATRVATVSIARAGIFPSHTCFQMLNHLLLPEGVRQDHIVMNRITDSEGRVTGAGIHGSKVGGDVEGRVILIPDPMGATGSSVIQALRHYRDEVPGIPAKVIAAHLIVTPDYIRAIREALPETRIYAIRLDRGMSHEAILDTVPGSDPRETGLDARQYIVPGGGGFGELLNNAEV